MSVWANVKIWVVAGWLSAEIRFFRVRARVGFGLGLGLDMVYRINFELAKTVEWFGGYSRFSESTFLEVRTCKQATNHPDRNGALRNLASVSNF